MFGIQHRDGMWWCGQPAWNAGLWNVRPERALAFENPVTAAWTARHQCPVDPSDYVVAPLPIVREAVSV